MICDALQTWTRTRTGPGVGGGLGVGVRALIEVRWEPALKDCICIGKTMDLHEGPCDKE